MRRLRRNFRLSLREAGVDDYEFMNHDMMDIIVGSRLDVWCLVEGRYRLRLVYRTLLV